MTWLQPKDTYNEGNYKDPNTWYPPQWGLKSTSDLMTTFKDEKRDLLQVALLVKMAIDGQCCLSTPGLISQRTAVYLDKTFSSQLNKKPCVNFGDEQKIGGHDFIAQIGDYKYKQVGTGKKKLIKRSETAEGLHQIVWVK